MTKASSGDGYRNPKAGTKESWLEYEIKQRSLDTETQTQKGAA